MKDFKKYSEENIHFYDTNIPSLVEKIIPVKRFNFLDLGCGDGRLLYALFNRGLLENANKVVGVDLAQERCKAVKKISNKIQTICSDACHVKQLNENSFDIIISNQVIEHIQDDNLLLKEIRRILKKGGKAYVSTVLKKWYGWYFYKNDGKAVLDPTHVREYKSSDELKNLFESNGLEVITIRVKQIYFPVIDLFIRGLITLSILKKNREIYVKNSFLRSLHNTIRFPIIGYKNIEVLATK